MEESVPLGIEWMVDAYGCAPDRLRSTDVLEEQFASIRRRVAPWDHDRFLAPDIAAMRAWVAEAPRPAVVAGLLATYPSLGAPGAR